MKIEENEIHFHSLMLPYFQKWKWLCKQQKNMSFMEMVPVCKWFARFRSEKFNLKDWQHSGKPTIVHDDKIEILIKNIMDQMTQDIEDKLYISHECHKTFENTWLCELL